MRSPPSSLGCIIRPCPHPNAGKCILRLRTVLEQGFSAQLCGMEEFVLFCLVVVSHSPTDWENLARVKQELKKFPPCFEVLETELRIFYAPIVLYHTYAFFFSFFF